MTAAPSAPVGVAPPDSLSRSEEGEDDDDDEEEEEEEENWDTASKDDLSWEHMPTPPTDYSNVPFPEEEEEGLVAAEASLPTKEDDEGIWLRCPSPCWRVREEWKQASYAQRVNMEKYYLVHGPDIDLTTGYHVRATALI